MEGLIALNRTTAHNSEYVVPAIQPSPQIALLTTSHIREHYMKIRIPLKGEAI
jgi:hypothetical protein